MMNVQTDRQNTSDWPYSRAEMEQIRAAVAREGYPPARRTRVGALVDRKLDR